MESESLHLQREAGVEMIVAIDSTGRGAALGGCRWQPYADPGSARREARDLARAMTLKAALAGLPQGGGKAVVIGDPRARTREQLLAFGRFVETLRGAYITAADMGTGEEQMAVIREATAHVVGVPEALGGCGSPAPHTALGVFLAIESALEHMGLRLRGASVVIQGAGQVGSRLAARLVEAGAEVAVAEPDARSLTRLLSEVPALREVAPADALATPCDVFAPCGPPGVIQSAELACRIVCGAANNPLAERAVATALARRGLLYVPDFLANVGGLIYLSEAHARAAQPDAPADFPKLSSERLGVIPANLRQILEVAEAEGILPLEVAERRALESVAAARDGQDLG